MSKVLQISSLIFFVFLVGCDNISNYADHEVVAIVKEQEITIGDLRFLHSDDTALDSLDWAVKVELVKQEVKDLDLDISHNLSEIDDGEFMGLIPENAKNETGESIHKFAKSQAEKLDMNLNNFEKEYVEKINKQNAYMVTYLEENLGEIDFEDENKMKEFNQQGEYILKTLVKENVDKIEVFIN